MDDGTSHARFVRNALHLMDLEQHKSRPMRSQGSWQGKAGICDGASTSGTALKADEHTPRVRYTNSKDSPGASGEQPPPGSKPPIATLPGGFSRTQSVQSDQ